MEKPKILLITGIHGNEVRSKQILNWFLSYSQVSLSSQMELIGFDFNSGFNTRDVSFNLNRMDQVQKLNEVKERMDYLKECINKADIIIDIHNTPICENKLLVSTKSLETLPNWKTYSDDYHDMEIWRLSNFESLSEYARTLGKIAFTAEFGGMVSNDSNVPPKDIVFLRETIDLCTDLLGQRKFQDSENPSILTRPLFTEYNRLVEIEIENKTFLYPGQIIPGESIVSINSDIDINIITESIQNYSYEVVSPESNYSNVFEGTIKKLKGTNNESTN